MATTIDAAFNQFLNTLRSRGSETEAARSHRASIEVRLRNSFGMTAFFRTGSFGNGTNVSMHSDVDYFAVIPTKNLKSDSGRTLADLADDLRARFPLTTGIRVDSPGVKIPFGLDGAEATEIVPVDATGTTNFGYRSFDMPDGNGGWMFSAPESHNAYVSEQDARLNGRLKPLIRFVKAWKFVRGAPISSFALEMYVTKFAANEKVIIYDIDLKTIFNSLAADQLLPMVDPRFSNKTLMFCKTNAQRELALNRHCNAADWATQAVVENQNNRVERAFERWSLVFNYNFPKFTG